MKINNYMKNYLKQGFEENMTVAKQSWLDYMCSGFQCLKDEVLGW